MEIKEVYRILKSFEPQLQQMLGISEVVLYNNLNHYNIDYNRNDKGYIMKLSDKTIQILKNFATINPSILVRPGNILKTITPMKSIMAQATIAETFEQEFAIYELPRFLGTISLFSDPEFTFHEKYVTISSGKQRVNYTYADSNMVVAPPSKSINFPDTEVEFTITHDQLSTISKAGAVLQMPEIAIIGEDNMISIRAIDSKNPSADVFSLDICECDKDFSVVLRPENLKLIPGDYTVSLTTAGISKFESNNLTYWIATEAK